ncbi:hypothetical protein [Mycolicibacterium fluoranthenivorans]|uniref:Uncharacterized protein n=1 Tax=Mycolicibacterium fluoranthenivorans TaxID=258505 RepID=A0A1G4X2L6_9MYCO|nr:hypothetical protein [Mycolicibacterium fluoranthenivorans]MCV7358518.1 hypothetical protein [Mycolicibacterium fluoranthenivorans]NIH98095.1 hypothetical protein [Mycolicibacterium fluoranthenivorans]SCX34482.1 hypothetical protein SAMN02799620_06349 [Mycolicibacterium fluoranthenivorans]
MKSIRVQGPFLSDAERKAAATGYTGPAADTSKLLGKWEPAEGRKFRPSPIFAALQGKHIYAGTVDPAVVAHRRKRNKAARRSRRINRLAGAR